MRYSGTFLYKLDSLGTEDSILMGVPISGVVICTNRVFGTANACVLFIKVSSFQGVLIKGSHCTYMYMYMHVRVCLALSLV